MDFFLHRISASFISDEEGGVELIEAGVTVPLFALMIVGVISWGYFMLQLSILEFATQQAARCSVIPLANGTQTPYCGFAPNSTFSSYGVLNTFGFTSATNTFSRSTTTTTPKITCVDGHLTTSILSFVSTLGAFYENGQQWRLDALHGSTCRPIQQQ